MSETSILSYQESTLVQASADFLYDLLSDITRTGEWSPVCSLCWWDDEADAGRVGAWLNRLASYPSMAAACRDMAPKLNVGTETLRKWILQAQADAGERVGPTSVEVSRVVSR